MLGEFFISKVVRAEFLGGRSGHNLENENTQRPAHSSGEVRIFHSGSRPNLISGRTPAEVHLKTQEKEKEQFMGIVQKNEAAFEDLIEWDRAATNRPSA